MAQRVAAMAGVGSQEWRDTREVVRTMQELYKHADEPATAVQIKEVLSEVQALFAARDTSMSEDVKGAWCGCVPATAVRNVEAAVCVLARRSSLHVPPPCVRPRL